MAEHPTDAQMEELLNKFAAYKRGDLMAYENYIAAACNLAPGLMERVRELEAEVGKASVYAARLSAECESENARLAERVRGLESLCTEDCRACVTGEGEHNPSDSAFAQISRLTQKVAELEDLLSQKEARLNTLSEYASRLAAEKHPAVNVEKIVAESVVDYVTGIERRIQELEAENARLRGFLQMIRDRAEKYTGKGWMLNSRALALECRAVLTPAPAPKEDHA